MRILIASSAYAPAMNGQAVFTANLAQGLAKRGHQVWVMIDSLRGPGSIQEINGVQVEELPSIAFNYFHAGVHFTPYPGPAVKRRIKTFQPEIVHIQDHYPVCTVAIHHARKLGIKTVGSNHFIPENLAPYVPLYPLIKPVINWAFWQWMLSVYRHADAVSAQSVAAARLIRQQGLKMPVLPISCGIDLEFLRPDPAFDRHMVRQRYGIDQERKIFLFLGRIDGEKRIELLVRAMQRLSRDDIQMVIAGKGRVEKSLNAMASDVIASGKVRFTGFIPPEDVPGLMNSIDVFVMPSDAELLSISTLEAMACARPVLLANALALPELLHEGENGYLFKSGDVADLVQHINLLADHPERWPSMGSVSREIAFAHSLDETVQKFELLYSQLITQGVVSEVKLGVRTPA